MTSHDHTDGCAEFSTSRRGLFQGMGALAGAGAVTAIHGSVFTQTAFADIGTAASTLVVLSMRGGADGLSLVVPHGDPAYYTNRPRIAIPSDRLLAKDGMFGLHPQLRPLLPMWNAGKVAAVQATGMQSPNRSHFAAMEVVEDADPGSPERRGWINRLIGLDTDTSPLKAMQFGETITPASMYGPESTLVTGSIDNVGLPTNANPDLNRRRAAAIDTMWGKDASELGRGVRSALTAVAQFKPVQRTSARPGNGANYPATNLGEALAAAARTIRADVGAEVINVDFGSWDMHANLGTVERGEMFNMANEMALAIAAFYTDLGGLGNKVTLVTISEFGRRAKENANMGLDHGYGNVMFLVGAGVAGGRYYGTWPGLASPKLIDGDLAVTTDYRSVLREVLRSRFNADTSKVFPGFTGEHVGVMTGS